MKKGFTLIELLAVIIVLTVIGVITTVIIVDKIDQIKMNSLSLSSNSIINAGARYLSLNSHLIPTEVGERLEISLETLVEQGLIKNIKSPINGGNCGGYLVIQLLEDGSYQNIPHLNCLNNFNNAIDDVLLAHYTFDNFQEPTENLFQNLNLTTHLQGGISYSYVGVEDGWLKYSISGTGTADTYPYTFNILPAIINSDYSLTFSFKYKTNVEHKYMTFGSPRMVNIHYKPGMTVTDTRVEDYFSAKLENVSPLQTTGGVPIVGNSTQSIYFLSRPIGGMVFNPTTDFLYFKEFQVERKEYATPYVNGNRAGNIQDSSSYLNNINIDILKTPRWINDSQRKGVYNFTTQTNVLSSLNSLTNVHANQNYSWGAFVKLNPNFAASGRVLMSQTNVLELHISSSRYAISTTRDSGGFKSAISQTRLDLDKWYHLFVTSDGSTNKLFINGKKEAEYATLGFLNPSNHIYIGNWTSNQVFNGKIDDVRVYGRTLSDLEVKALYETIK
jgi:prepilin-type N-terminal cleavage/methylation domain-containing protein